MRIREATEGALMIPENPTAFTWETNQVHCTLTVYQPSDLFIQMQAHNCLILEGIHVPGI